MTAPAPPSTAKGKATWARLVACARAEAIRTGGTVEIAPVAEAAGVVPSLVNRYFGSKAGLVSAVVDDFFDRLHAQVLNIDLDSAGDWATHERLRLEQGVQFHYADPFAVVLYTQLSRDPLVARTETERIEIVIQHAAHNIRRGQQRGELPAHIDPEFAGAAMFGAMRQVMVAAMRRRRRPRPEQLVGMLWPQVAAAVGLKPEI
ncbi:TetR/AcrR family transcriptional regulator [Nocardia mexicana]|uniref:TetR family transcriptional regulator n=1 Tax=Nocardia mexicana TaxID=279262 RepID=A0A370H7N2_9NOCA|nr:TetR/AcrR family transcriptional regulator [Nocardia mexicana]RDI52692.1 TetR family transcriptional regulator [Nocardia mexicana]